MNYLRTLFFLLILPVMPLAQDLSVHQWENRVLLILSESSSDIPINSGSQHSLFQAQLDTLQQYSSGLRERKLLIYQVMPSKFRSADKGWQSSSMLYQKYKQTNAPFEVVLIGLDGSVKLRQTKILSSAELFAVIDGMPMRRAELQRQKN